MNTKDDLRGLKFGRLTATRCVGIHPEKRLIMWECICECGTLVTSAASYLVTGNTRSCGCLKMDILKARCLKHGSSRSCEYNIWNMMLQRCNNGKCKDFPAYGGRGIRVCDRWSKFENFLADMGRRPSTDHSIDRVENDGNYEPSNCKWATMKEQQTHKTTTRLITFNGVTQNLTWWANSTGININTIHRRIKTGWALKDALTVKSHGGNRFAQKDKDGWKVRNIP